MVLEPELAGELADVARQLADAARGPTLAHFRTVGLVADNKCDAGWDLSTRHT